MKKHFLVACMLILFLFGCVNNEEITPDYIGILFPQENPEKDELMGRIFMPGIHQFPQNYFSTTLENGISRKLIEYQIDDNNVMKYTNPDPRDQKDHRLKFQDGTRLEVDFKCLWELKTNEETGIYDIETLLNVLYKLEPEHIGDRDRYTIEAMCIEYVFDVASQIIRARFKQIENYFVFSEEYYTTICEELIVDINNSLGEDCPIVLRRLLISNDTPEQITKAAMVIQSAIERDIELIREIGPYLRDYPEVIPYLQLKFAENNTDKIGNFTFNSLVTK